ncbi:MAG: molybdopterin-guanine dinucleotide biosynthesis protein B, partial [Methanobrevibacter sp.]|nr:molybdopterin-guanine dinucleotide biosynthesis protein B [Methanobrevibacter sp.]
LEINGFTKNIIANSIKGMIKSIKTEDNVRKINIEISEIEDELINAKIRVKTNQDSDEINDFTQGILKETIYAIVNTLKIDDEINKIEIEVEE